MEKILHVVPSLVRGGTESFIMNNYEYVDKEKMQFDFLVFHQKTHPLTQEIEEMGGRVFYSRHPSLAHIWSFYKEFKYAVDQGGPYKAVHCHVNTGNAVPLLCSFLCGIKVRISHSHAVTGQEKTLPAKIVLGFRKMMIRMLANMYLACSVSAGDSLYGKRLFRKKGIVCNNGIDVERFASVEPRQIEQLKKEFQIRDDHDIILGNITRFDHNKNQAFLIDVFYELLKIRPRAVLLLGGYDGGLMEQLQQKAEALGIAENVRFIGQRADMPACLQLMDVYVFPSIREGLGIALLEAQAADCLCVASTGVPDANLEIGNAYLLELSMGAKAWADFIEEKYKEKKPIPIQVIKAAFREKGFDVASSAREMIRIYEDA